MRFVDLHAEGEPRFTLELNRRVTVLAGLGADGRQRIVDLLHRILRGDLDGVRGTIEVHDVVRELSPAVIAELGLPGSTNVVIRAQDLPGAEQAGASAPAAPRPAPPPPKPAAADTAGSDRDKELADIDAALAELDARIAALPVDEDAGSADADAAGPAPESGDARIAHEQATSSRQSAEAALEAARRRLAPDAATAASEASAALDAARSARSAAAEAVERLVSAERGEEAAAAASARTELADRKASLEARREDVLAELSSISDADPGAVATALAEARIVVTTSPDPLPEAVALAGRLEAAARKAASFPSPPAPPPALIKDAEAALATARADVAAAESSLRPPQLSADDIADLEYAHQVLTEAERRADRRLAPPGARKRLALAQEAERGVLDRLGLSSYGDYLLRTTTFLVDSGASERLTDARAALADAEAVWQALHDRPANPARDAAEADLEHLRGEAAALVGAHGGSEIPEIPGLIAALRDLRSVERSEPPTDGLVAALEAAGVRGPHEDPRAAAEAWLAAANESHARRATLQAELATVVDDLAGIEAERDAAVPVDETAVANALEEARAALAAAQAAEHDAQRAMVAARARADEHRAAEQRVAALEADLAGAVAAETHAGSRVDALASARDEKEARRAEHDERAGVRARERAVLDEQRETLARRRADLAARPAPRPSIANDATVDIGDHIGDAASRPTAPITPRRVDKATLEVYVLARVASQRDVGDAGALPLVLDDPLGGMPADATGAVLDLLERFSPTVQVVYLSDDPAIEAWAATLGAEAAVRRFTGN